MNQLLAGLQGMGGAGGFGGVSSYLIIDLHIKDFKYNNRMNSIA